MNRLELDRIAKLEEKLQDIAIEKSNLIKENENLKIELTKQNTIIRDLSNKLKELNKNEA